MGIIVSTYFDPPEKFSKTFPAPLSVQIQDLSVGFFELVPLLDDKVQDKFLENFCGGLK